MSSQSNNQKKDLPSDKKSSSKSNQSPQIVDFDAMEKYMPQGFQGVSQRFTFARSQIDERGQQKSYLGDTNPGYSGPKENLTLSKFDL